ncbi:MAG: hypothetical protein ACYDA8_02970 [Deferrisomatales bacterium]
MPDDAGSKAGPRHPDGKVGIYWYVEGVVVGDAVPFLEAEPYGEALQHGGHYEFWLGLKPRNPAERTLKEREYDYYPRGRAVFFPERGALRLYVDPCLNRGATKDALDFFGHDEHPVEVEQDEHYRCARCNTAFLELA